MRRAPNHWYSAVPHARHRQTFQDPHSYSLNIVLLLGNMSDTLHGNIYSSINCNTYTVYTHTLIN
jgi:hypothetical protein